ncbi:MAG: hypothetical protein L7S56_02390 [Candidatus Poseidonia sp.]|nr:hypothetical protein [Poseidonia sp.]
MSESLGSIIFQKVEGGRVVLGTTKGGWIYAGQRPCYEAVLPTFFITEHPLTKDQVSSAMGAPMPDDEAWMETLSSLDVNELATNLMASKAFQSFSNSHEGKWEIRCPTVAEWHRAKEEKRIHCVAGLTERLGDGPVNNHRGAMMDGRPRPNELLGPAANQAAAMAIHPKNTDISAVGTVPFDRPLPNVVVRLVMSPIREAPAPRVPHKADFWANLRSEAVWITLLGIVPSFLIPIARGMSDYATEGWFNLFFGGLCAGFFTGAFWRPNRPIIQFEDAEIDRD